MDLTVRLLGGARKKKVIDVIHRRINIPVVMTACSEAGGRKSRFYVGGAQAGV